MSGRGTRRAAPASHAPRRAPLGGGPRSTRLLDRLPGVALVAAAASLWGTDGVLRSALVLELPPSTIVMAEHALIVAVLAPLLPTALRAARRLPGRDLLALALVGVGASAVATMLFTAAFRFGDPTTPLLLQKLQPAFAVLGAAVLLGERVRPRYVGLFAAALAGAWLIAFPDPFDVSVAALQPALLALGAAALWALGTVLGRHLTARLPFGQLTTLRFAIGLPASAAIVAVERGVDGFAVPLEAFPALAVVALVPGLVALLLYYRGLGRTTASAATLAELAFPVSAIVLGAVVLDTRPAGTQWVGVALVVAAIALLPRGVGRRPAVVERPRAGVLATPPRVGASS